MEKVKKELARLESLYINQNKDYSEIVAKERDAERRIDLATIEKDKAADVDEYNRATKALEAATREREFYRLQKEKMLTIISRGEFIELNTKLENKKEELVKSARENLRTLYNEFLEKMEAYNNDIKTIQDAQNYLNVLARTGAVIVPTFNNSNLLTEDENGTIYDSFTRFCRFYDADKANNKRLSFIQSSKS